MVGAVVAGVDVDGTTILDSHADSNGASGISAGGRCTIRNNTCTSNADNTATGAGIYVASGSTLIEGNHCVGNSRGIRVVSSGNTLIGNIGWPRMPPQSMRGVQDAAKF